MLTLLVIFLNIVFLGKLALMDVKTHTVPVVATTLFVLCSFFLTTPQHLMQACFLCILLGIYMYIIPNPIRIGTGDRKIIFGLTLQLGWYFGLVILGFALGALGLKRLQNDKNPIPLVPMILIAYIIEVFCGIIVGNVI